MSDEYMGHAVVDGVPQFLSVSALEKADASRSNGCLRAWFYRYVLRFKDKETASKVAGTALHAELADYLRTGNRALSAVALSGLHMVPDPGPDLLVEQSIGGPKAPFVTADGIPLVGKIDCAHDRGVNKGTEDITEMYDPPGTVEVIDWKWKKDGSKLEYYKQPAELVHTIQMSGYGVFVAKAFPDKTHVRLSHGYFPQTRARPRKVTKLHVIEDCLRSWEYTCGVARSIRHVARETSPERVDFNRNACDRYGGCPYREAPYNCSGYQTTSLAGIFGETETKEITMGLMNSLPPVLAPNQLPSGLPGGVTPMPPQPGPWAGTTTPPQHMTQPQGSPQYQAAMAAAYGQPAQFAPQSPQQVQAPAQFAPQPQPIAPQQPHVQIDMRAQLAAEEAAMRAQQTQVMQGQPAPAQGLPPGFTEACAYIAASGRGFPTLTGNAAQACALAGGQQIAPGMTMPGQGNLGNFVSLSEPEQVISLANDFRAEAARQPQVVQHNTAPQSILPPDAPASDPRLAAKPVEGYIQQAPQPAPAPTPVGVLSPAFAPQPQMPAPDKPKRTRKPKAEAAPTAPAPAPNPFANATPAAVQQPLPGASSPFIAPAAPVAPVAGVAEASYAQPFNPATAQVTNVTEPEELEIYVDCIPNGPYESFRPYLDKICDVLCQRFIAPGMLQDIRCAPKDSQLAFGGWRGGVRACVLEVLANLTGALYLDTRGNEIAEEAASALQTLCERRGAKFVRGVR